MGKQRGVGGVIDAYEIERQEAKEKKVMRTAEVANELESEGYKIKVPKKERREVKTELRKKGYVISKQKPKEEKAYAKARLMQEKRLGIQQKHEFVKEAKPKKISGRRHKSFPVANKRMREMNIEARRLSGRSS